MHRWAAGVGGVGEEPVVAVEPEQLGHPVSAAAVVQGAVPAGTADGGGAHGSWGVWVITERAWRMQASVSSGGAEVRRRRVSFIRA